MIEAMPHLTYRQLLDWITEDAKTRDHTTLDEPITVRMQGEDEDTLIVGGIRSIQVESGCTEQDSLVIDGDDQPSDEE
jgi:hypothetical protein